MATVWIAFEGEYQDRRALAAFTSRGAAIRCWAQHYHFYPGENWSTPLFVALRQPDVEELSVDPSD